MKKVLVTGATGQIGSELTLALRNRYGNEQVVAGGHVRRPSQELLDSGPFEIVDCTEVKEISNVVQEYSIDTIYHLAAILSASAEKNPILAYDVNVQGMINILEVAREFKCSVFTPSSIGAFGSSTPLNNTPQDTIQRPGTIYGISKVYGELICDYYFQKYGVDTRGVRYPGIISNVTLPGGGTTDYAVEIFYCAIRTQRYTCYLKPGTFLDMMYMPDAIQAAIQLMEVDGKLLIHRNAFNVTSMSVEPEQIASEIRSHIPDFKIDYDIDPVRQSIAESWPDSMDDSAARNEWGWLPRYDLKSMVADMVTTLGKRIKKDDYDDDEMIELNPS